jgi:hypothetical protein
MVIWNILIISFLILTINSKSINKNEINCDSDSEFESHCSTNTLGPNFWSENFLTSQLNRQPSKRQLCSFCFIIMPIVRTLVERNQTEYFHDIATYICQKMVIADSVVCDLVIKTYQVGF